ncbi:DUF6992 family protein [Algoriphagus aquimarinus]|uniref:Uncharacterized protein n=1 Tax=Algoriphagus aquimarinus TaxID=237018 RepID=A0A1I1B899_9BACT|nr:hypothetical protein [Algoriphagus aquimarinus]SFB45896.1 hypothetical protein SAMN04489723_11163 [Algoriphagus aquimarinus]|tara:strand:- start:71158 stop:71781 length:624 start_codon:yes stop_codon:yes gene_type:complete
MLSKSSSFSGILFLILILLAFIPFETLAQNIPELTGYNQTRISYNEKGMLILGGWAVGNMIWGGIAAGQTSGQTKAFHQMNLYWNSVNLVIAGFGYWQATKENPGADFWSTMEAQQNMEKILLFNAALDVAYIAGGMYLKERGLRINKDKFVGFGKSIILQGAFLLTFDAVMYTFHHTHAKELPQIVNQISFGPTGFNISIPLGVTN